MDNKSVLGTNFVAQIAIVVHDIEKTSQAYADFFGIEKPQWALTDPVDVTHTNYRGNTSEARAKLAFINVGENITIELIEPDEHPSTWRETLDQNGEGIHHIAFRIKGMQEITEKLEARNMPLIQKGEFTNGRYAYFDTLKDLKVMIELLESDKS